MCVLNEHLWVKTQAFSHCSSDIRRFRSSSQICLYLSGKSVAGCDVELYTSEVTFLNGV